MRGHAEVREYWTRQFETIDPRVEPQAFSEDEQGRIVVEVHQVVRDRQGNLIADQHAHHVYTIRGGLIARMDIRQEPNRQRQRVALLGEGRGEADVGE